MFAVTRASRKSALFRFPNRADRYAKFCRRRSVASFCRWCVELARSAFRKVLEIVVLKRAAFPRRGEDVVGIPGVESFCCIFLYHCVISLKIKEVGRIIKRWKSFSAEAGAWHLLPDVVFTALAGEFDLTLALAQAFSLTLAQFPVAFWA